MDATVTLFGSVLASLGVLGAAVERDRLERQVAERDVKLAELNALHAHDQSEIARLLIDNQRLGGTP
ncbi:hypothetical protein AB0O76_00305 [Streptomyces sp. NPDC086554]|uniref:hypothetical protein n=1 Tax=Streptomyces sp. NPDC086554 TaxID=3154864 RepID=UPI00342CFCE2